MRPAPHHTRQQALTATGNAHLHAWATQLLAHPLPGLLDVVPAYTTLYVEYDADRHTGHDVRAWLARHEPPPGASGSGRHVTLRVRYDGEDLPDIAARTGLSEQDVVALHAAAPYRVYAVGFVAGFPFLGEVPPALRLPRRDTPRARVPAHSVAIANAQTGVYPVPSPGGWHLLGHALDAVYDPHRPDPFLLHPGDTVTFTPTLHGDVPAPPAPLDVLPAHPRHPTLHVDRPGPLDLVQDEGRFMGGRHGLVRAGYAHRPAAHTAHRLLGTPVTAPLLELHLGGPTCTVLRDTTLSVTGNGPQASLDGTPVPAWSSFAVRAGQRLTFRPGRDGRVSYLALPGGLDATPFLGSASTDLRASIGRPLRAGDTLGSAEARRPLPGRTYRPHAAPGPLRLLPFPDHDPHVLATLLAHPWTVQDADRMGVRLHGHALAGGETLSQGNPVGSVQVPPGGQPLILLHDKGTLGGYSTPARVHPHDLWRLADLRPGDPLHFRPA
ncbi:5-oxoprolinase subunit PxpB [Deinococcus aquiradiocola]|uniref:Urea carboxylase n=1 Tax=Deinococcus aquiradiocola TaxID=393059 RepID=A0A917URM1_9DEIO|nr:5-oxoprolinase subunit PxpB [Deinococcus aquiradiocola]GGJ80119.1 urea carboxylase [Deinococcus aquiradiocola]